MGPGAGFDLQSNGVRRGAGRAWQPEAADARVVLAGGSDRIESDGRGGGGLILVDWRGRIGFAHSTPFMPVAWMSPALDAPRMPW